MAVNKEIKRLEHLLQDFLNGVSTKHHYTVDLSPLDYLVLEHIEALAAMSEEEVLEKWKSSLNIALGDKIPPTNKKPRDPSRIFPHEVTGELKKSMSAYVNVIHYEDKVTFRYTFEFSSLHSILTNVGIIKNGITAGRWKGWMDDAFFGNRLGRVLSAKDLLEQFFTRNKLPVILTKK